MAKLTGVNKNKKNIWKLELLWWAFTLITIVIVLLPIYTTVPDFPFYMYNAIFIAASITFTRYIFLLKHTPISHTRWIKLVLIFTAIPITVLLIDGLSEFQRVTDEEGYVSFLGHLTPESLSSLGKYIKAEYFFFGVSSVICSIIIPFRMIISIFRVRNKGTV